MDSTHTSDTERHVYIQPRQQLTHPLPNGRYFTDDVFGFIFVFEKFCILIQISMKFVPKGPIDNNPALV